MKHSNSGNVFWVYFMAFRQWMSENYIAKISYFCIFMYARTNKPTYCCQPSTQQQFVSFETFYLLKPSILRSPVVITDFAKFPFVPNKLLLSPIFIDVRTYCISSSPFYLGFCDSSHQRFHSSNGLPLCLLARLFSQRISKFYLGR